jgi:hypothetical protein
MTQVYTAFQGNAVFKQALIDRFKAHWVSGRVAPNLKMTFNTPPNGESGVMGATVEGEDEREYESQVGVPAEAGYLHEIILYFCGHDTATDGPTAPRNFTIADFARDYPVQWLQAIPVGADLRTVTPRFIAWLLHDCFAANNALLTQVNPSIKAAGLQVSALYKQTLTGAVISPEQWSAARKAAVLATDAVEDRFARALGTFVEAVAWPLNNSVGELRGHVMSFWFSLMIVVQNKHMTADDIAADATLTEHMETLQAASQQADFDHEAFMASHPAVKAAFDDMMSPERIERGEAIQRASRPEVQALARRHFEALLQLTRAA